MKHVILTAIAALMLLSTLTSATTITVSNRQDSPGQFEDLQEALNNAFNGDTILVAGSPTSYGLVEVRRQVTIIGDGYNRLPSPENNFYYPDGYNSIALFDIRASNVYISGFKTEINLNAEDANGAELINITIERCWIDDSNDQGATFFDFTGISSGQEYANIENIKFINNIIGDGGDIRFSGRIELNSLVFSNNIFFNIRFIHTQDLINTNTILFTHNNFFRNSSFPESFISSNFTLGFTDMIIRDNIFYKTNPFGGFQCAYIHNLLFVPDNTNISFPEEEHVDANNKFTQPDFEDYTENSLSFFGHNFNLAPNSEALDAASDSTDIGITGGAYPFDVGDTPRWAEVIRLQLEQRAIPEDGTLKPTFEGKGNN